MSALITGACAEAYVYFRLLKWGFDVHFASGINTQFDLWINLEGIPIRIQVKGTCNLEKGRGGRLPNYCFGTAKGCSKKVRYAKTDYDILALVALPEERVYFTTRPRGKSTRIGHQKFTEDWEKQTWEKVFKQFSN